MTLFGKPADQEDSGLSPQNNHLFRAWMPGSFIDQRWGELRSKVKRPLTLQTAPRMASLRQGTRRFLPSCRLLVDRVLSKGTLV